LPPGDVCVLIVSSYEEPAVALLKAVWQDEQDDDKVHKHRESVQRLKNFKEEGGF
jgi:hypothetical protein